VSSIAGLTDRCTVAAYVIANTTRLNGPNYTTSRDVTPCRSRLHELCLDDEEWTLLTALPALVLRKRRHMVRQDGSLVADDEHEDGTLIAGIDDGEHPATFVPE
jgi:hypothetical protein